VCLPKYSNLPRVYRAAGYKVQTRVGKKERVAKGRDCHCLDDISVPNCRPCPHGHRRQSMVDHAFVPLKTPRPCPDRPLAKSQRMRFLIRQFGWRSGGFQHYSNVLDSKSLVHNSIQRFQ